MENDETYALTWKDILFGLTGSTIFVMVLHVVTGL